jgi:phage terminase large subunit-like protein
LRVSVDAVGTAGVGTSMWGGSGVVMADVQARVTSMLSKRTKRKGGKKPRLAPLPDKVQKGSNVVVVRVSCKAECTIDTVLRQSSTSQVPPVAAASIDVWLQSGSKQFAEKFSQVFGDLDNFPDKDKRAAAAALSNAIGVSQSPLVD